MPFFPAYTDHSPSHISDVLSTASSIITDESKELLTSSDIAVLVLGALLHDCAMHLTEDSFRHLVESSKQNLPISLLDRETWDQLWANFLSEASRFDGRKLRTIFGDNEPVDPRKFKAENLTERDKLLIGEFIRTHHARLAHEIALFGVPGPDGNNKLRLPKFTGNYADIPDLIGLVARSHGMPIRETFEYLEKKFNVSDYKGIHTVFLMVVLRVSDYLQVQSERAPKQLLLVKKLRSPISVREWDVHHAVRDIRTTDMDPEALYIDALPANVKSYVRLRWLLDDIQKELDQSWAILGEVYGRLGPLRTLGLTIRRIRSSIDNLEQLSTRVTFLPAQTSFDAAGTDLLKLLVGPLYKNQPGQDLI